MADYGFQDAAFQLAGASGNQTISLTGGPGKTIKGYVIALSGATALDTITGEARMSVGFCDGTTQRSVGISADNGALAVSAGNFYRIDTATVIQMPNQGAATLAVEAAHVSMGTDQITINVSAASTLRGVVRMFYGNDLVCLVESFASDATIGNSVPSTSLGVPVDLILACSVGQNFVADGSGNEALLSFGGAARLPGLTQCCDVVLAGATNGAVTSSGIIVRDDALCSQLISTAGTVTEGVRLDATFGATNVSIFTRNANTAMEAMYMSLSFGGAKCRCAVPVIDVSATGDEATTDVGFGSRGLLILANQRTSGEVNAVGSGAASGRISLGFGLAAGVGRCISFTARDNQATSQTFSGIRSADVADTITDATTHDYIASLPSIESTGFTLNVSDAAAASRLVAYIAVEDLRDRILSDTETITDNTAINVGMSTSDTETISDQTALNVAMALSDTEGISEFVVLVSTGVGSNVALIITDTVDLSDRHQLFGEALIILSDTETISEAAALFLGRIIVLSDVETITDEISTPLRTQAERGSARGTSLSGEAEEGWTYTGGAERGEIL